MSTIIDSIYEDTDALLNFLEARGEISFLNAANETFPKSLLLAIASYFESVIRDCIMEFAKEFAAGAEPLLEFVKNKAIERQYHTYFQWDRKNANAFFGLFGSNFKEFMVKTVDESPDLEAAIKAFLELGQMRNELVHENFATHVLEKTAEEIHKLYCSALLFVQRFPELLRAFCTAPA